MSAAARRPSRLIVDDEPQVAEVIAALAGRAGCDVVCTSSPHAFVQRYFVKAATRADELAEWLPSLGTGPR